ncbi:hypothetical protein SAMN05216412_10445 [Nitrosospira multiformis]|uniref:Uncharacterized protein n=1 Tax=Nitrosospira multiformis TaxID=1231 RepID=A0A1I0CRC6_9PROT|nr:hypothetical protein [Nitrosospira multiformis]SET21801.1 hypothetical protein SAMN05216412_10445 [Nitrosospira multiformis]
MNNRKLLFILALLLLTPLVHGQEAVPPSSIGQNQSMNANVNPKTQPQTQLQSQSQRLLLPQAQTQPVGGQGEFPPNSVPVKFEGIVVQVDPLAVKSVNGDVQTFIPSRQEAPAGLRADWPNSGDLVLLTYVPRAGGHALTDIEIVGKTIVGTIKEIAEDDSWIVVRTQLPEKREYEVNIPLQASADFKPLVSAMRQGDGIRATYVREGGINSSDETAQVRINHVRSLEWQSEPVGRAARWASLLIAIFVLFILAYIFTRGHPTHLYLGRDNRYSSSKFQTFLWFWLVISAYIAIVSHRIAAAGWSYVGGVDIPPHLLILSGISVLTFAGAKAITTGKVDEKPDLKQPAPEPKATDLICDDNNRPDLGDFQMVAITILTVIIYAISAVEFMENIEFRRVVTMPDVDATLLSIFGLGQAAYLGKKAAGEE